MKKVAIISRILTGLVFIYSGFVKVVDPLGTAYKFTDYFVAFGMEEVRVASLFLSFLMCAAEFLLGISLLFNIKTKISAWGVALFMAVFTPITLYLALKNPVSDCGCFGDALILTNWQTFYKNIIIDIIIVVLLLTMKHNPPFFNKKLELPIILLFIIGTLGFETYNYRHLPIVDFRPYKEGVYMPEEMKLPEGAPVDSFAVVLTYEKDGVQKEFTQENYPWQDSTWKWVKTDTKLVKEGAKAHIHDFSIVTTKANQIDDIPANEDVTDMVLSEENYSMLLVCYHLDNSDKEAIVEADKLAEFFKKQDWSFYGLTASSTGDIEFLRSSKNIDIEFYTTDEITLKTVVRSNPGYVLLKKGTIIKKWHHNDAPSEEEIMQVIKKWENKK